MADQTEKRQLDRSEHDVLDLEPVKRKRSCSPSTSHGSESYSALQHASRPRSSTSLRYERKRLLYVMQQVSAQAIVTKIRKQLESELVVKFLTALSNLFDPEEYPPPSKKHIAKCSDCGEKYDTQVIPCQPV